MKQTKLSSLISDYRTIITKDGIVDEDYLIEMLKLDDEIPQKYQNDSGYKLIAKEILETAKGKLNRLETMKQRMELYNQGLTDQEIADMQGLKIHAIKYWRSVKGLPMNKKEPSVATEAAN